MSSYNAATGGRSHRRITGKRRQRKLAPSPIVEERARAKRERRRTRNLALRESAQ